MANPRIGDDNEEESSEFEDDDDEFDEEEAPTAALFRLLSAGPVKIRVHNVIIKGNHRTKAWLIESEVADVLRSAETVQELVSAAEAANLWLRRLGIFDAVSITLDGGPEGMPGTADVVIEVVETGRVNIPDFVFFSKPGARFWFLDLSVKLKNYFGYADIWDISGSFYLDQPAELSAGLFFPRFKSLPTPLSARVSILSQDWLKFSSYKQHLSGLSFGLLSTKNHNLTYNLTWHHLTDPLHQASKSIRKQLGNSLLSSVKYSFNVDQRDSLMRPMRGYAFLSSTQIGGLGPDSKSSRFVRQEFDVRAALPLGFFNSALNFRVAAGVIMPWGRDFLKLPSPLPDRYYMGGNSLPICTLGAPTSLLGFKTRGLGPIDSRRLDPTNAGDTDTQSLSVTQSSQWDALGGDLAVTGFADLSFDLPIDILKKAGIFGHMFVSVGNLTKLTEGAFKDFSPQKFCNSARMSAGYGLVVPTPLGRMEINYCHIVKQSEYDQGKTGIQFNFSS